jgi:hypothetical protein
LGTNHDNDSSSRCQKVVVVAVVVAAVAVAGHRCGPQPWPSQRHKHNLKADIEIKIVFGWTLSKEVSRHHYRGARPGWDEVNPGINNNKNLISSQTLYLCLEQCLSAFLVRPNHELHLYAFSIPDRKKRLVHLGNRGI